MRSRDPEENKRLCKAYYYAHKEERKAKSNAYYWANREQALEQQRKYNEERRSALAAKQRAYYERNKEAQLKANRERALINRERYAESKKLWSQSPRGKASRRASEHRRRAFMSGGDVSTDVINRILSAERCHICGRKFTKSRPATIDHVVPLSKGGLHVDANLAAAHLSCNSSKNAQLFNPMSGQGLLL